VIKDPPADFNERPAIKIGYLSKQGGRIKTWHRRWMILKDGLVVYYKDANLLPHRGVISLASSSIIERENYENKPNAFSIVTPERIYHLFADTEKEMVQWIEALRNARPRAILPQEDASLISLFKDQRAASVETVQETFARDFNASETDVNSILEFLEFNFKDSKALVDEDVLFKFLSWFYPLDLDTEEQKTGFRNIEKEKEKTSVKSNYTISRIAFLVHKAWFFGALKLDDAEELLRSKPFGTYLIRFGEERGSFVLSMKDSVSVGHWKILSDPETSELYLEPAEKFAQLHVLVNHYHNQKPPSSNQRLTVPCQKRKKERTFLAMSSQRNNRNPELNSSDENQNDVKKATSSLASLRVSDPINDIDFADAVVHEKLSENYNSYVYRCTVKGFSCAVKVFDLEFLPEVFESEVFNEVKFLQEVSHNPLFVKYLYHIYTGNQLKLFMEYLPMNLKSVLAQRLIDKKPLKATSIRDISFELARALSLLHSHKPKIIHRDLKPDNIYVTFGPGDKPSIVKLGNFGLSKFATTNAASSVALTASSNTVPLASLRYIAPEMRRPHALYDESVDVFGFGLTMVEMITLKPTDFVDAGDPKSITLPEVPPVYQGMMDIAKKCLSPNPVDRPTADQLMTVLGVDNS
jgi:tRNA A-37 threonylcarbamoyl transferase component Bud32